MDFDRVADAKSFPLRPIRELLVKVEEPHSGCLLQGEVISTGIFEVLARSLHVRGAGHFGSRWLRPRPGR